MNVAELVITAKDLNEKKQRGYPLTQYPVTRDRLSNARMRDLNTHVRSLATALGRATVDEVCAVELTDETFERVKTYLVEQGKNVGVVDSTMGSLRLLRDLAREEGLTILEMPALVRPARSKVYRKTNGGPRAYVKAARAKHVVDNSEYGLRLKDWPEHLRKEYEEGILPFFCDPYASKRSQKRPASPAYVKTWLNRAERAMAFLLMHGVLKEQLGFKLLADYDTQVAYSKWLYKRRGNRHTMTTKGDLEQWRHLAAKYFDDLETGKKLSELIHDRLEFEEVKDKGELVLRAHPDDIFVVFQALVAEAQHYEANVRSKYGRVDPMAAAAHKWMEAGIWGLTYVTWLREGNISKMTPREFQKQEDGTWRFRFSRSDMKSKRQHSDLAVDLWKGREGDLLLNRVLEKVVEMRPRLVERFLKAHPGRPAPEQFFLNMKGRPYGCSTLRNFYTSASVRFLGVNKRLSFHDVRTIVPSWLFVREGDWILRTVQRRLDHAHLKTTEQFYLKVEKLFDSRRTQLQMEERAKQKKAQERLAGLPDEVAATLDRFKQDILAAQGLAPELIERLLAAVEGFDERGLAPTLPPPRSPGS